MIRSVFIARNRSTGFHSLIEVVGSGDPVPAAAPMGSELADRLLRWGTLDELVEAISESGPLVDRGIYREEGRRLSISEAIEIVDGSISGERGFERCNEKFLYLQLCLEGTSATGSASSLYPSRASVSRDVKRHGLIESGGIDELRRWREADPGCTVVVEPLEDIVLCRNLGSLVLRLMANIAAGYDDVLERSGFRHFDEMRRCQIARKPKGSYWAIPFKHDPSIDMTLNYSTRRFGKVFAYMVVNPLETRIFDRRPKGDGDFSGSLGNAVLMSSRDGAGEPASFFDVSWKPEVERTQLYLGIDDTGSQGDGAVVFVESVAEMLAGLTTVGGNPLGWSVDAPSIFDDEPAPIYRFHSTAAAMFGAVFYRYGYIVATCKYCGNGILVKTKGKRREFCSPSCRTRHSHRTARL